MASKTTGTKTKNTGTKSAGVKAGDGTTMMRAADIPLDDLKRDFFSIAPKDVEGQWNATNIYYRQWMLRKILSRFELEGAPDFWDMQYFWTHLFLDGTIAILDTTLGVIPLRCGYSGINAWDRPTTIIIANHVLGSFERTIGKDGALVHLQYDYMGINPILNRYSELLASVDSALAVNLMNSKVSFLGFVDDLAQARTMQKMYDRISGGEPAVFVRKGQVNTENFILMNVKQTFIADDLLLVRRKLVNDFLSDIGIDNANLDKRERLNEQEVNANNDEVRFNLLNWVDCVQEGLDVANSLYNLRLKFKVREINRQEGEGNELTESNTVS